ncbi:MAG TPA: mandelate racemase/muconate lactonizing enzyme family protein [Bacillota bacterium]|nr:mandelate racemase/muconate lactonizing enzyme family protein [Bacillota bacterium]
MRGLNSASGRIVGARLRVLRAPVDDGIAMSFAPMAERATILVEVETADGLVGRGESWVNFPPWAFLERVATLRDGVFPLVLGEDADAITALHSRLVSALEPLGRQWGAPGPVMQAISGVDIALWDRRGLAMGRSVAELAGRRVRETVPAYASSLGPADVGSQAAHCRELGFGALKVKVGFGRQRDEDNLRQARDAAGPDMAIFADANQAWSVDEAVAMAPVLWACGVAWLEEPVRGNRVADLEALHAATGLVIATGENVYGREAFRKYVASPAVAIVQPDVTKAGGLTEALAVAEMAQAHGKAVAPHLYGGAIGLLATLQLCAAMPAVTVLEYDVRSNPLRDALLASPPRLTGGRMAIPQGAGLGLALDEAAVAAVTRQAEGLRGAPTTPPPRSSHP